MARTWIILALCMLAALAAGAFWLSRDSDQEVRASLALTDALGGDTTGYARVMGVHPFSFPADHGPHPAYKTEWWYYTGNLEAERGRRFGYQFTIFRIALAPQDRQDTSGRSDWATNQLYMGHFTVTDAAGNQFYDQERFSRGAAGLAGAQPRPFRVWLEDWSVRQAGAMPRMEIEAQTDTFGLHVALDPLKPIVLQGDRGYDRKGPNSGDASYYYSIPRLETAGSLRIGADTFRVHGLSWMDREWSTSALGADQLGWDWFSLHLSNGDDLMYYQIREQGGVAGPFSHGVLVGRGGHKEDVSRDEVRLEVLDRWQSPRSGATYPAAWRLSIPKRDVSLTLKPYVSDQELNVSVRYWEGAASVEGSVDDTPVTGNGYVELTGYEKGEPAGGRMDQKE